MEFTGLEYLKIDIANNYGLDKLTWNERLSWFQSNQDNLESLIEKAENPACFTAGLIAYRQTLLGEPTGYMISLDATHSGLQILSLLTGDTKAARLCNIINNGEKRSDSYTEIFNKFRERVPDIGDITRNKVKKAIMTAFYSSQLQPRELVGEKNVPAFNDTLAEECPYCWTLNSFMLKAWNPDALSYSWDMPDGFHVEFQVEKMIEEEFKFNGKIYSFNHIENQPTRQGRCLGANMTHACDSLVAREMVARCMYDPKQIEKVKNLNAKSAKNVNLSYRLPKDQRRKNNTLLRLLNLAEETNFISMRILDLIDETNYWLVDKDITEFLINSLPDKPFDMIVIHDCFKCHPNHGNDIRKQYRFVLQQLSDSRLLEHILRSITKSDLSINKPCNIKVDGEYALS